MTDPDIDGLDQDAIDDLNAEELTTLEQLRELLTGIPARPGVRR